MQSTESERLTILIETLKEKKVIYNQEDFCKKIGKNKTQISIFKNKNAKRPLDANKLFLLIVSKFPFVNIEWLKNGEGEMFLNDNFSIKEEEMITLPKSCFETITSQQRMLEKQTDTINRQLDIIERLTDSIGELKKTSAQVAPRECDAGCAAAG